jgi:hypothetical protein
VQVISLSRVSWRSSILANVRSCLTIAAAVLLASLVTLILIFGSQYLTWTPVGHGVVEGVQGRYFFAPILVALPILAAVLAALLQRTFSLKESTVNRIGDAFSVFLIFMILLSQHFTAWILLDRYYLEPAPANEVTTRGKPVTAISAAVVPTSQTTVVDTPVTGYATIINAGRVLATECSLALPKDVPANFLYQVTDRATNTPVGRRNIPIDIAPRQAQSFLFVITPTRPVDMDVSLDFLCANSDPAPVTPGVNTFRLITTR